MTDKQELLPCPFCGGLSEIEHMESGRWTVGCADETCIGYQPIVSFPRQAEAIDAWNRRTPDPELTKVTAERDEALEGKHIFAESNERMKGYGKRMLAAESDLADSLKRETNVADRLRRTEADLALSILAIEATIEVLARISSISRGTSTALPNSYRLIVPKADCDNIDAVLAQLRSLIAGRD